MPPEHRSTPHDVLIIGGSFAGLSAALYLGRARRDVCVVDAGLPRNRFAARAHGIFGHDGSDPAAILATARGQVAAYPTVAFVEGTVLEVAGEQGDFTATLADGTRLRASYLLLVWCSRSPVSTEGGEAPLQGGATTRRSSATVRRSNDAGVDAAPSECHGTSAPLH